MKKDGLRIKRHNDVAVGHIFSFLDSVLSGVYLKCDQLSSTMLTNTSLLSVSSLRLLSDFDMRSSNPLVLVRGHLRHIYDMDTYN